MRISLVDQDKGKRKRRRRRRSRDFETAVAFPRTRARQRPKRQRTPERQQRARPRSRAAQPAAAAASAERKPFPWRLVLARTPVLLILAGLIGVIIYISVAEEFFVYEAEIVGTRYVDPGKIYEAAQVHEQHIFWIRPETVAEQVIGQVAGIKAVTVRCGLPARVTITVEEREPLLMWRAESQGRDWWLDPEGVVLPYGGSVDSQDTIFVVDGSERHLQEGEHITPDGIVNSVLQLAAALPEIRLYFYQSDRGLSFWYKTGGTEWPVYVGDSQDLRSKILAVQTLTDYLVEQDIQARYVDVRWADYPVYGKPLGEDVAGGE